MNEYNPQIEKILDDLAEMSCEALQGKQVDVLRLAEPMLKNLLMSGFDRQAKTRLQKEVEDRMEGRCRDSLMHRGAERSGVTGKLQAKFDEMAKWQATQPKQEDGTKPANISSATDA